MIWEYPSLRNMSTNMSQPSKGPFGNSEAHTSEIKSVDNDKSEAKEALFAIIQDSRQLREEIDSIKIGMQQLMTKLEEIISVQNKTSQILGGAAQQAQGQEMPASTGNLIALKDILDSKLGDKLLEKLFPTNSAPTQSLISQEVINEKMTRAFMDDLDTGESIRKFISDSLKKRATKEIVNQSLGSIGKEITHEPA